MPYKRADYSWYPIDKKKPEPYALVSLCDENGKVQNGWWGGGDWNFGRRRIGKIIKWKKLEAHEGYVH